MARNPRWHDSQIGPIGAKFIELNKCSARVQKKTFGGGYEWTTWIGPGVQTLHNMGNVKTQAAAKRAAIRACKKFDR